LVRPSGFFGEERRDVKEERSGILRGDTVSGEKKLKVNTMDHVSEMCGSG
jgi:hypothetical protein